MEEKKPQKARIVETMYDPDTDTVSWKVELKTGDQIPMVWPRKDFGPALGIKGDISPLLVQEFNQKWWEKILIWL